MPRLRIILCLAICLLSVGTSPFPIGRIKKSGIRNIVKREVNATELHNLPILPIALPQSSDRPAGSIPRLPISDKQLPLKTDLPPPLPPNRVTELSGAAVATGIPTRADEALGDLDNIEKDLKDLQQEVDRNGKNTTVASNLEPVQGNHTNLNPSEDAVLKKSSLQSGADSESETAEQGANTQNQSASEIQPSNESALQASLSKGESALPPFSPQPKMEISTEEFSAIKEADSRAEKLGKGPPINSPSEQFKPSVDMDNIIKDSSETINNLPQRLPEHVNKPMLGRKEDLTLKKVMEKAQNMPLEYDSSRTFLEPEHRGNPPGQNWEGPNNDVVNNAYMKGDTSQGSTELNPMETKVLGPTPLPSRDATNKNKLMARLFPPILQKPTKPASFQPQQAATG